MSKRDPKELERVADAVSNGHSDVRRLAEYAGERGGEQMLNREGRHIPEAFHSVQPRYLVGGRGEKPRGWAGDGRHDVLPLSIE